MQNENQTTIIIKQKSNSMGKAGFILAVCSIIFSWVPIVNFVVWGLGALFSFIGLFKSPRGLAIAGFVLSFVGIITIVLLVGAIVGASAL